MKKNIYSIILILLSIFSSQVLAQTNGKINGVVKDSTGKVAEGIIVSLLNINTKILIKTSFTDEIGKYEFLDLTLDSFCISIVNIGYQPYLSELIFFNTSTNEYIVPDVQLKASKTIQLSEVNVVSKIPFVERKLDRTIINPDALISNAGGNAMDVLSKSPGIMVDENGGIKLKGKSGVMILIDDKPTYLTGSELENYLKSLPSSAIKQIEIMTNPPAQYEAAGNAGIINIKTKKSKLKGINGNVSLNYGQGRYHKTNDNFSLNFSNKKIAIFSNISYGNNIGFHDLTIERIYKNDDLSTKSIFNQNTYIKPNSKSYNARVGLDYYISDKTTIGITTKGLINEMYMTSFNAARSLNADESLNSIIIGDNSEEELFKNGTINLNIRHQFDSLGKSITADVDYVAYSTKTNQTYKNDVYLPDNTNIYKDIQTGYLPSDITIYAFKSDYTHPFKKELKFDAGIKTSYTKTDNKAEYFITQNDTTQNNYNLSNHFIYDEMINAAYINLSKSYKRIQFQTGLRFESTTLNGKQLGNPIKPASEFTNNYNNLFPTAFLSYQLDTASNHTLTLSYGKRINRPFYKDLNPFSSPLDKFTFYEGNPFLKPTFAHNFSLAYGFKEFFSITFSYSNSSNQIQETIEINNGIYYSRPGNIGSAVLYNLSVETTIPIKKWITTSIYSEVVYSEFKSKLYTQTLNSKGTYWYGYINNSFQFKKGWSAELNGEYITNFIDSQFLFGDYGSINIGIQKKILKEAGSLRFNISDVLFTNKIRGRINNLYLTDANWYGPRETRVASITFSYRFGKNLNSKPKHAGSGSEAEQNRVK